MMVIFYKICIILKCGFYSLINRLFNKNIIIDVSGTRLTPGNGGTNCLGNGEHTDIFGRRIECCCDECDYYVCCLD